MESHHILPFYLTYPLPVSYQEEDKVIADLNYLMQLYPTEAKRYQKRIAAILDKLDYDGSVIYDDYPDRIMLYKMADDISNVLFLEEQEGDILLSEEKKKWIKDMVAILLFHEIYRRRHNNHRGFLRF